MIWSRQECLSLWSLFGQIMLALRRLAYHGSGRIAASKQERPRLFEQLSVLHPHLLPAGQRSWFVDCMIYRKWLMDAVTMEQGGSMSSLRRSKIAAIWVICSRMQWRSIRTRCAPSGSARNGMIVCICSSSNTLPSQNSILGPTWWRIQFPAKLQLW